MKKIVTIGLIVFVALAGFSSCDFLSAVIASVSGSVVNAMAAGSDADFFKSTDDTLVGATITLTDQSSGGTDASGTVGSDGTFSILNVTPGRYLLSGTKSGWTFVPRLVDVTGFMTTLPTVIAYPTPTDLEQILVLVEWENTDYDVDSYMVRDTSNDSVVNGTIVASYDVSGDSTITLDRDVTTATAEDIPRVETIRVSAPVATGSFEDLRYYLRMYTSAGSLTGSDSADPAGATVFVMQGTTHFGTYPIAYNSYENVLGVVAMRWNVADQVWNIGSFGGAWLNGDGEGTDGIKSVGFEPVVVDAIQ